MTESTQQISNLPWQVNEADRGIHAIHDNNGVPIALVRHHDHARVLVALANASQFSVPFGDIEELVSYSMNDEQEKFAEIYGSSELANANQCHAHIYGALVRISEWLFRRKTLADQENPVS